MNLLFASAARATVGARSGQEDAFRLWPADGVAQAKAGSDGLLAVLADGMGGHAGGAVAGETACSMFAETFAAAEATPYEERLQSALQASNEALAKGVAQNAALRGMGCTLIAAWIDALGIRWTSVGDSLLLLYRFPDVIRLNADHSLGSFLDEQARQKRISQSEAKAAPNRNALRSALTGNKIELIDLRGEPMELRAGDWIVLASDGICTLGGDELADVIYRYRESTPEEMADGLISAVVSKGAADQDNTTVVAVRIGREGPVPIDELTTRLVRRSAGGADGPSGAAPASGSPRAAGAGDAGLRPAGPRSLFDSVQAVSPAVWLGAAAGVLLVAVVLVVLVAMQLVPSGSPSANRAPTTIRTVPQEPSAPPQPAPLPAPGRSQEGPYVPPFAAPPPAVEAPDQSGPRAVAPKEEPPAAARPPADAAPTQQAPQAPAPRNPPRAQKSLSQPAVPTPQ